MERGDADDNRQAIGAASFRRDLWRLLLLGALLFVINLVTSPGSWWFYWPLFGIGIAVAVRAFRFLGDNPPAIFGGTPRQPATGLAAPTPPGERRGGSTATTSATAGATIEDAEARVARLWRTARSIPGEAAREQAFRVCAAADRVAEVLALDKAAPEVVLQYVEGYLAPAEAILGRYARLAQRGVAAAEPTLAKVEQQDLPLLAEKFDALYERLHRGDVVDLAVASEMLELGDPPAPSPPPRLS